VPEHINIAKRSDMLKDGVTSDFVENQLSNVNIIVGDSMGEMQTWYAMADVVFIGGSLVNTGGHNPLEATIFGVPVVSGPHMFNFEDVSSVMTDSDLLYMCEDEFEITSKLSKLLSNNSESNSHFQKSESFMQQHRGVTARLMEAISSMIKN